MFIVKLDKRKKESYYKQIVNSVKDGILKGQIKDGQRMPKIEDVAQYFHISTIAVTLAYEQLAKEGFLRKVKGKGTFVQHRPIMTIPMEMFYDVDYFFDDIKEEVRRDANYIEIENNQTTIKFTTYIKGYPTYHQDIVIFNTLDVDVQTILDQPLSLYNVFFQFYDHQSLTYESYFQTKNANFQDAIILDIHENEPMFYIITNIHSENKLEAIVKTYYPGKFVNLEANI